MSESGRTAFMIVNATSPRVKEAGQLATALQEGGVAVIRRECAPSRLPAMIASIKDAIDCVVLVGNDGFFGAGAIAVRDRGLPLGILPAGPGSELGDRLGLAPDPAAAAAAILGGHTGEVALGAVNGRPFFAVCSVGLSVDGARSLRRSALHMLGRLRYVSAALQAMVLNPRFSAIIRCGAVVHRVRTVQITIGLGRVYGGGMPPGGADPATGLGHGPGLHVYSLEPGRRWGLLFLSRIFTAPPGQRASEVRIDGSQVVEVVTRLPQSVHADGEVVTVTPARFSLLSSGVRIFVPPPAG